MSAPWPERPGCPHNVLKASSEPKTVVGVSLGSSRRDHRGRIHLSGVPVLVERRGTDGNLERAVDLLRQLDGQVDAIGLGGIDRWLIVDGERYAIRDAERLVAAVTQTPVLDGKGLKEVWEPRVIDALIARQIINPEDAVLMVSALDRFGMADTFYRRGFPTVAGDLIFAAQVDYPILSRAELVRLAKHLLPEVVKRPFAELYPIGAEQDAASDERYRRYFDAAQIIAGDFHLIRRYWPNTLEGKVIITNTTTAADVEAARARSAKWLITTTPEIDGRSFGTNVMEAAVVAVSGVTPDHAAWAKTVEDMDIGFGALLLNP